ncbi:ABC transporter permease [Terasakiella sp. A23]|uniref:ABC transporter permease n=1 Tax=Terasakiella sp. FCG-A23 TaxID=3080561 RepID=UPI0029543DB5|nr:ABC transporter permease [Terasakiella sp. A23]MDV7338173.1 ABC transporter permease [Terasakiella sp. A23]
MTPIEVNPNSANWLGLWTLYSREVRRFLKVYTQTLLAPLVTTLLFFAVFTLALGRAVEQIGSVPFMEFLAPGLVMMAITQNAFANTSSSLVIAKIQGNIVDTLMPPLNAHELTFAYAMGGTTRGIVIGTIIVCVMSLFVPMGIDNFGLVLFHGVMGAMMLSLLGIIGGIWSVKFDHIAAVTNFVVTPLSFLSGTFYSIERLPEMGKFLASINPFFYMIDGFRSGFIGQSDSTPMTGILVMLGVNSFLWFVSYRMFKTGYKLKA